MPSLFSRLVRVAAMVALVAAFAPAAGAAVLMVTYTSSYVGTEIFEFNTDDGSEVPATATPKSHFRSSTTRRAMRTLFSPRRTLKIPATPARSS
jgi:hypothetical protein